MAVPRAITHAVREPVPAPRRRKRAPIAYVVEVAPCEPDPKAAEQVVAWLRARVR